MVWACEKCTFDNQDNSSKCEMCSNPRPSGKNTTTSDRSRFIQIDSSATTTQHPPTTTNTNTVPTGTQQQQQLTANVWVCPQCTLNNPLSKSRCDACNFENPAGASGPWVQYEMTQMEYDHLNACYFNFLSRGSSPNDDAMGKEDMTRLCRFLNFAHSPEQINAMFAEIDKDRSGYLSCKEFITWCAKHRPDPQLLYGLTQPEYHAVLFSFDRYDSNHDGWLTAQEATRMILDKGMCRSAEEAAHVIRAIDLDGDQRITLHELLVAQYNLKRGLLGTAQQTTNMPVLQGTQFQ